MPRRHQPSRAVPKTHDELSFPVPFREHAKFLDLADRFLELVRSEDGGNLIRFENAKPFRGEPQKKAA